MRRHQLGQPEWERTQDLVSPLRAVNGLPITLSKDQAQSAKDLALRAMQATGVQPKPAVSESVRAMQGASVNATLLR